MPGRGQASGRLPINTHWIFLIGLSCFTTYFLGLISSYLILNGYTSVSSTSRAPVAATDVAQETARSLPGGTIPSPDLPSGDVFLLALTIADSADITSRFVQRRSWTKIWKEPHPEQRQTEKVKTLMGSREWLKDDMQCTEYFRHYFVISQFALVDSAVLWEAQEERDLLLTELYFFASPSLRMTWALTWSLENVRFRYLVKTEINTFLYVPAVLWWLRESKEVSRTGYYSGSLLRNSAVVRDTRRPWYISQYTFSEARYPEYIDGGCIVMTRDTVRAASKDLRRIMTLDGEHPRQVLHVSDIDVGLSLYHAGIVANSLVHVYGGWQPGLCKDTDLIAVSNAPRDVLLRAAAGGTHHICD